MLLLPEQDGRQHRKQQSDSHTKTNRQLDDLTAQSLRERDDGSSFLMLLSWEAASPANVVSDDYVVTIATRADRELSGHKNTI